MAKNFNQANNGMEQNREENRGNKRVFPIPVTAFNSAGFAPVSSTYKLTEDQIKKEVLAVAKRYISDFKTATLEFNYKNGAVISFVWLNSNSEHLRDSSTMSEKSAIRKPITRYSKELKEFMDKFCLKDNRRIFPDERGSGVVGIVVDLRKIFRILFDDEGFQYSKENGNPTRTKSFIKLTANYHKGDNYRFGRFKYLEIEKSLASALAQGEPKATRSYKV